MQSKQIKRFVVVILGLVALMLCWAVFWPTNFSLPHLHIFTFNVTDTFSMFLLCNFIILALNSIPHLGFSTNSNGGIADDSFDEDCGETAYCQQHIVSCQQTGEHETPDFEDDWPPQQMKFIYSAEDVGDNAGYSPNMSEKVGRMDIINYSENCAEENCCVSLPELMQLVEVPFVIDTERANDFDSMIDEDFNRRVEEFIAKFNRQLRLQSQQPMSRCGLRL